ncbi:hypothetical protein HanLR1_Chr12g0442291 [Helianthus annuus]|nr:hypothetical protein HanLR1_Chr12g0442291 [Helianthus annuus]
MTRIYGAKCREPLMTTSSGVANPSPTQIHLEPSRTAFTTSISSEFSMFIRMEYILGIAKANSCRSSGSVTVSLFFPSSRSWAAITLPPGGNDHPRQ